MSDDDDTDDDVIDLETMRLIKEGEEACERYFANDPRVPERRVALAKLREGMRAMLDHYAKWRPIIEAIDAREAPHLFTAAAKERSRMEARDDLVAEILNRDNPPLHYGIPENELSEIAFWVLGEALEAMWTDERTWKNPPTRKSKP